MLATPDLHKLTQLADQHQWRLVLVGDPHQLQAVGRGGMFAELCATGRTIELEHVHRFRNAWEAAASLKLRHGDPTGLDAYLDHDRIVAAPFAEHVDNIALAWAGAHARGEHLAITTTTNQHVNAINRAVQTHRLDIGQLGHDRIAHGDEVLYVGDVVTTRRNQRLLRTTTGEPVRNRDYWTINALSDAGVTVTRIDGHGTITLPADYVRDHVQLGYAATEPGNQSDTATRSITLATPATTCRGLYVAVTRGRDENLICVVTDTHDINDAVDTLHHILTVDRADRPANHTRRDLATSVPPAPALVPRCSIPDWVHDLRHDAHCELADARSAVEAQRDDDEHVRQRLVDIDEQLDELAPLCAPHDHAIANVRSDLEAARGRHRHAERTMVTSSRLHRHGARVAVAGTANDVTTAQVALDELTRRARPLLDRRDQLHAERDQLRDHTRHDSPLRRALTGERLETAEHAVAALDTWYDWANGRTVAPAPLVNAAVALRDLGGAHSDLAEPLLVWLQRTYAIQPPRPAVHWPTPTIEPPGLDIGM